MGDKSTFRMYARTAEVSVEKYRESIAHVENDVVVIEEPLEIRLLYDNNGIQKECLLTITMRTPGDDRAMAIGFLFVEGIITSIDDVRQVTEVGTGGRDKPFPMGVLVELQPGVFFDPAENQRRFFSTSSCGICGSLQLQALPAYVKRKNNFQIDAKLVIELPDRLGKGQTLFKHTGGLHAAGLFDSSGQLMRLHEDIGRHNALDKLIGHALLDGAQRTLSDALLLFSGRVSFELMQKAIAAGIRFVVAIGAPSSLAVEMARSYDITLIGFLRGHRFNVYAGARRLR